MFKFLPKKPNYKMSKGVVDDSINQNNTLLQHSSTLLAATLSGVLLLSGCQQQAETQPAPEDSQSVEKTSTEDSQPMRPSDSAATRIKQFQPIYVAQAQRLQRRLQAEYESLQAADSLDSEDSLLINDDTASDTNTDNVMENNSDTADSNTPSAEITDDEVDISAEADINTSTEVGERDLTVLKRISLEPRKPVMLTEDQIIESYQQAMEALYQPVTTPLSAEDVDTLINIATLAPQLFEHAEIAGRLSAKSPALARLIIQHQVWEQIEAQQVIDMQQMKLNQQKEFETLMTKFNDTIKGYDEQIAKYEQTLKEFQ
ncbi:hypothetical protein JCM18903_2453 [Psychrobacter sp. JCM 18903]|uniref:hypothetical protein n=1 Tax=Psychrobacter sp. JCM 18903 TaxID=1298610 RepID=UPI0004343FD7|nr:hypothetical protein [Psychrobacter sp. JCM 18903]GAF62380.1 hypothetical protein JCM18903_2453 [Psychrobacter sp. JCM 18903]